MNCRIYLATGIVTVVTVVFVLLIVDQVKADNGFLEATSDCRARGGCSLISGWQCQSVGNRVNNARIGTGLIIDVSCSFWKETPVGNAAR